MFQIPYLEMPITHICSLHCDGCSAYANYNIKKTVSLETATSWFETWSKRIAPNRFRVLGGEPFIHPDLPALVLTIRNFWPEAHIQVCTNGLNLDRHPEMGALLAEENMSLWLSVHSREPNYVAKINKACETLESWTSQYGTKIGAGDNVQNWNRFYHGVGRDMEPFTEQDPVGSWKACHSKHCLNLVEGRLWKCPQIGNLPLVADRFGLGEKESWKPYLAYEGLGPEVDDATLGKWLAVTRGVEDVCAMCPVHLENYEKDVYNLNYDLPGVERVDYTPPGLGAMEAAE